MDQKIPEVLHLVRLHKVDYECNTLKHTVYFKEHAERATESPLMGWANPGNSKAHLGFTEGEAIEKLRQQLKADILYWMQDADLTAFSFTVAVEKVENGATWTCFRMIYGHHFKVHEPNDWR